jgi:carbon storage regulator CsrA
MLVFSRKYDEGAVIQLGDRIVEVVFLGNREGKGRIGFKADPDVLIHRQEVYEAIQKWEEEVNPLFGTIWGGAA